MSEPAQTHTKAHNPFIVFTVAGQSYALSHTHVMEMVQAPPVVPVPHTPTAVRGVINLRGHVMGVVDFRTVIGLSSSEAETQELVEALEEREREHKAWLNELEASIREDRDFNKTTDPHACAFGRWFDNFSTKNLLLTHTVERFAQPHARIHSIAKEARSLCVSGSRDAALALIEKTRDGELATMISLFHETRELLASMSREIAIIVHLSGGTLALLVDSVDSIRTLSVHTDADFIRLAPSGGAAIVNGVATTDGNDLILLVDPTAMVPMMAA